MKVHELLIQPYPCLDAERSVWQNILRSGITGLFIALFLIIFQPFGINNWQTDYKVLYLLGFGAVTWLCLLILRLGFVKLFPSFFSEKNWTVGKEIITNVSFLITIALGNYLYAFVILFNEWRFVNFLWSLFTVVCVGVFPIAFDVYTKYIKALKKYGSERAVAPKASQKSAISLVAENRKDMVSVSSENLLYIESADNYSKVVFQTENEQETQELLRSSLSRLENQLTVPEIVRCHRSYIVNLNQVNRVTGNAQGYKLHLKNSNFAVPVARKYSDIVHNLEVN